MTFVVAAPFSFFVGHFSYPFFNNAVQSNIGNDQNLIRSPSTMETDGIILLICGFVWCHVEQAGYRAYRRDGQHQRGSYGGRLHQKPLEDSTIQTCVRLETFLIRPFQCHGQLPRQDPGGGCLKRQPRKILLTSVASPFVPDVSPKDHDAQAKDK